MHSVAWPLDCAARFPVDARTSIFYSLVSNLAFLFVHFVHFILYDGGLWRANGGNFSLVFYDFMTA